MMPYYVTITELCLCEIRDCEGFFHILHWLNDTYKKYIEMTVIPGFVIIRYSNNSSSSVFQFVLLDLVFFLYIIPCHTWWCKQLNWTLVYFNLNPKRKILTSAWQHNKTHHNVIADHLLEIFRSTSNLFLTSSDEVSKFYYSLYTQ